MAANDERIVEYFRAKFNNKRLNDENIDIDIDEKLATKIDIDQFIKSIETECWQSIAKLSWRPFQEARSFVHTLELKNYNEWRQYSKSGKKPEDISADPVQTYKNEGWKS